MSDSPPSTSRSVKIADDERGGWSSDRPRPGGVRRPIDISGRCSVLRPADRIRYSPGSLLLIASPSAAARQGFAERLFEDRASLLSKAKVQGLLAGRISPEEIEARAHELLHAAARKRLDAGESTVVLLDGLLPEEREPYLRAAHASRRPRHLILLEVANDDVPDEDRSALNALRRALDAGELGQEGIQTALRLNATSASELKQLVFRPAPREE